MQVEAAERSHEKRIPAKALVKAGVFTLGLVGLALAVALAWPTRDEAPTAVERPWI